MKQVIAKSEAGLVEDELLKSALEQSELEVLEEQLTSELLEYEDFSSPPSPYKSNK